MVTNVNETLKYNNKPKGNNNINEELTGNVVYKFL